MNYMKTSIYRLGKPLKPNIVTQGPAQLGVGWGRLLAGLQEWIELHFSLLVTPLILKIARPFFGEVRISINAGSLCFLSLLKA
nr:hypothetical protein [Delftia sp. HK171]